ncbi:MAG: hypothetical protein IBX69_16520 [Anaerolineales bacterium]|nr:hypothetical protein [Anaerolineales bacterium]
MIPVFLGKSPSSKLSRITLAPGDSGRRVLRAETERMQQLVSLSQRINSACNIL